MPIIAGPIDEQTTSLTSLTSRKRFWVSPVRAMRKPHANTGSLGLLQRRTRAQHRPLLQGQTQRPARSGSLRCARSILCGTRACVCVDVGRSVTRWERGLPKHAHIRALYQLLELSLHQLTHILTRERRIVCGGWGGGKVASQKSEWDIRPTDVRINSQAHARWLTTAKCRWSVQNGRWRPQAKAHTNHLPNEQLMTSTRMEKPMSRIR